MAGAQTVRNELLVYYLKDMQNGGSGNGFFFSICEEVAD
jgi:hypothetical protein